MEHSWVYSVFCFSACNTTRAKEAEEFHHKNHLAITYPMLVECESVWRGREMLTEAEKKLFTWTLSLLLITIESFPLSQRERIQHNQNKNKYYQYDHSQGIFFMTQETSVCCSLWRFWLGKPIFLDIFMQSTEESVSRRKRKKKDKKSARWHVSLPSAQWHAVICDVNCKTWVINFIYKKNSVFISFVMNSPTKTQQT